MNGAPKAPARAASSSPANPSTPPPSANTGKRPSRRPAPLLWHGAPTRTHHVSKHPNPSLETAPELNVLYRQLRRPGAPSISSADSAIWPISAGGAALVALTRGAPADGTGHGQQLCQRANRRATAQGPGPGMRRRGAGSAWRWWLPRSDGRYLEAIAPPNADRRPHGQLTPRGRVPAGRAGSPGQPTAMVRSTGTGLRNRSRTGQCSSTAAASSR